jgi:hypothetical protein
MHLSLNLGQETLSGPRLPRAPVRPTSQGKQVWETAKVTDLKNGASIHLTANGDTVLLYTDKGELI